MNIDDTVRNMLLTYPGLSMNRLDTYNHLFCTLGGGYEWINGELIDVCAVKKSSSILTERKAIRFLVSREIDPNRLISEFNLDEKTLRDRMINTTLSHIKENLIEGLKLNHDIEKRISDLKPYSAEDPRYAWCWHQKLKRNTTEATGRDHNSWHLYPCMSLEHANICNFPDNTKPGWLVGIDFMLWFLVHHKETYDYEHKYDPEYKIYSQIITEGLRRINVVLLGYGSEELKIWNSRNKKTSLYEETKDNS